MSDELQHLSASLPPEEGSDAADFERRWRCVDAVPTLTAHLILLAEGKLSLEVAERLHQHLHRCSYCQDSYRRFAAKLRPVVASTRDDQPQGWDALVQTLAELFNDGARMKELLEHANPETVLAVLCEARDRGLIAAARSEPARPERGGRTQSKSLLELLQERSRCLKNVVVRQSCEPTAESEAQTWEARMKYFGCEVAPTLLPLLGQASCVGVAWGPTVTAAISGLQRHCPTPPPRQNGPLTCVATVGGLVGELSVRAESSSSILASRLAEAINGDWKNLYTLHGLEAFISFTESRAEIETIRKRISRFPNYQAIFGSPGAAGVIDQLDAIVTSCGNAHHYSQFWSTELPRIGVTPEQLNDLTHGNMGGVLLEREDLDEEDHALFMDIAQRWTGITRRHFEQCARRRPGVILLALGNNKADVVLKCVTLNLVTELIIDEDLAMALWDRIDPQRRQPRTLEAVLCRQVHTVK